MTERVSSLRLLALTSTLLFFAACGGGGDDGGGGGGDGSDTYFTVTTSAGSGGTITPESLSVAAGATASFTVTPEIDYAASAIGCGGTLDGNTFTTAPITSNCTVEASFTPNDTSNSGDPDDMPSKHVYVQDFWVYERIARIGEEGDIVDITADIVGQFSGEASETVNLDEDLRFEIYPALDAHLVNEDGEVRTDVDVVAGIISTPEGRALAALATPHPDAEGPITIGDKVSLDLTFLAEKLQPGDPMLVDFSFLQTLPAEDGLAEVGLQGPELLRLRLNEGRFNYLGEEVDGENVVLLYTNEFAVAVAGSTKMETPVKAQPMMDGFNQGITSCLGKTHTNCLKEYWKKFGGGATDSLKLIECNLGCGPDDEPDDNPIPGGEGDQTPWYPPTIKFPKISGDPHFRTFDGTGYSLQAVGEFVAARSDELEVQIRTGPRESSQKLSVVTAVAIEVGGRRLVVDAHGDSRVRVDGNPVPLNTFAGEGMEVGGAQVTLGINYLRVEAGTGDTVMVRRIRSNKFFDIWLEPAEASLSWVGLLGDRDDNPDNDFQLPEGTVLEKPLSNEALYKVFADAWRISDGESLFYYPAGMGTTDFTDLDFPSEYLGIDSLDPAQRLKAEIFCRSAGVVGKSALDECVFDFGFTGDPDYVGSALFYDIVEGIQSGIRDADGVLLGTHVSSQWEMGLSSEHAIGDVITHDCPWRTDLPPLSDWSWFCCSVIGTDTYAPASPVCMAALHAGKLERVDQLVDGWRYIEAGGIVLIEVVPGLESYTGTTRNNVWSINGNGYDRSFIFR